MGVKSHDLFVRRRYRGCRDFLAVGAISAQISLKNYRTNVNDSLRNCTPSIATEWPPSVRQESDVRWSRLESASSGAPCGVVLSHRAFMFTHWQGGDGIDGSRFVADVVEGYAGVGSIRRERIL